MRHVHFSSPRGTTLGLGALALAIAGILAPLDASGQAEGLAENLNRYSFATFNEGVEYYNDRDYTIVDMPDFLEGSAGILTSNDDKNQSDENWLTFDAISNIEVYIAYDSRAFTLPNWLEDFEDTGLGMSVTDTGASPLKIYKGRFAGGTQVTLGGNRAVGSSDSNSNYTVMIIEADPFSVNPEGKVVQLGESVTFNSELAFPEGTVDYQWQLDTVDIPSATNQSYTIPMVDFADEGFYRVVATDDSKAENTSQEAELKVVGGPGTPAAGVVGLAALAAGLGAGGVLLARRRK